MEQEPAAGNADLPWSLNLDERGNVILLHDDPASLMVLNLGPKGAACESMCQFLASIDYGECG